MFANSIIRFTRQSAAAVKRDNRQGKGRGHENNFNGKQVAELLQVSIPQVRRMIANGELSAMKVGREWRVPKAALEELFERELL